MAEEADPEREAVEAAHWMEAAVHLSEAAVHLSEAERVVQVVVLKPVGLEVVELVVTHPPQLPTERSVCPSRHHRIVCKKDSK